jgi:hypothetical protein
MSLSEYVVYGPMPREAFDHNYFVLPNPEEEDNIIEALKHLRLQILQKQNNELSNEQKITD